MSKIKSILAVAGVVLAFMGSLCSAVNDGVDSVERIKSIKEGN